MSILVIASNAQTILSKDIYTSPLMILIGALMIGSVIGIAVYFQAYTKSQQKSMIALFAISTLVLAGSVTYMFVDRSKTIEAMNVSNANITKEASDKYGINLLEKPIQKGDKGSIKLIEGALKANDTEGKRIQVFLELTDDEKSILLFSNGRELPLTKAE